jgi:hypothetical protein
MNQKLSGVIIEGDRFESTHSVSFNPADIKFDKIEKFDDGHWLYFDCLGGQECANYYKQPGDVQKTKKVAILFCNPTSAQRIERALQHVKQFYSPSKPLPF